MEFIALLTLATVAWGLFVVNLLRDLLDSDEKDIVRTPGEVQERAPLH